MKKLFAALLVLCLLLSACENGGGAGVTDGDGGGPVSGMAEEDGELSAGMAGVDEAVKGSLPDDPPPETDDVRKAYEQYGLDNWRGSPYFFVYSDRDGNGIEEMFVAQAGKPSEWICCVAYTGSEVVVLAEREVGDGTICLPLQDGTFARVDGTVLSVWRIAADGYTLEEVPDSPIVGKSVQDLSVFAPWK